MERRECQSRIVSIAKSYKLPYSLVEPVEREITELKRQGRIEPSDASYASPLVSPLTPLSFE